MTQPGQVMRVEGEGMPVHNFPMEFGSLFVEFRVVLPASLAADKHDQVKELLQ